MAISLLICCSFTPREGYRYHLDDPELAPFSAMYEVEREQFCLSPIDKNAVVEIERDDYATRGYHVTLHMYSSNVVRAIAFAKQGKNYIWLGEQEIHRSGRKYMIMDYEEDYEHITITYNTKGYSGGGYEGLDIHYDGDYENVELSGDSFELSCEEVKPYIEEWDNKWRGKKFQY